MCFCHRKSISVNVSEDELKQINLLLELINAQADLTDFDRLSTVLVSVLRLCVNNDESPVLAEYAKQLVLIALTKICEHLEATKSKKFVQLRNAKSFEF